jgi:hypothetical protein
MALMKPWLLTRHLLRGSLAKATCRACWIEETARNYGIGWQEGQN